MKRTALIILVAALGLLSLVGKPSSVAYREAPSDARKAPDFVFPDLKGQEHTLNSLHGKVVVVDLWATWCPPCKKEIPSLVKLQKKYGSKLAIIGVSYDDTREDLDAFLNQNELGRQINYPIVFGPPLPQFFGEPEGLPTTYIIDKKGNIRSEHVGLMPFEELDKILGKLISEE